MLSEFGEDKSVSVRHKFKGEGDMTQLLIIFGNDNFVAEWEKVKAARLMERINADNKNND